MKFIGTIILAALISITFNVKSSDAMTAVRCMQVIGDYVPEYEKAAIKGGSAVTTFMKSSFLEKDLALSEEFLGAQSKIMGLNTEGNARLLQTLHIQACLPAKNCRNVFKKYMVDYYVFLELIIRAQVLAVKKEISGIGFQDEDGILNEVSKIWQGVNDQHEAHVEDIYQQVCA